MGEFTGTAKYRVVLKANDDSPVDAARDHVRRRIGKSFEGVRAIAQYRAKEVCGYPNLDDSLHVVEFAGDLWPTPLCCDCQLRPTGATSKRFCDRCLEHWKPCEQGETCRRRPRHVRIAPLAPIELSPVYLVRPGPEVVFDHASNTCAGELLRLLVIASPVAQRKSDLFRVMLEKGNTEETIRKTAFRLANRGIIQQENRTTVGPVLSLSSFSAERYGLRLAIAQRRPRNVSHYGASTGFSRTCGNTYWVIDPGSGIDGDELDAPDRAFDEWCTNLRMVSGPRQKARYAEVLARFCKSFGVDAATVERMRRCDGFDVDDDGTITFCLAGLEVEPSPELVAIPSLSVEPPAPVVEPVIAPKKDGRVKHDVDWDTEAKRYPGETFSAIAMSLGVPSSTVWNRLKTMGLLIPKTRKPKQAKPPRALCADVENVSTAYLAGVSP